MKSHHIFSCKRVTSRNTISVRFRLRFTLGRGVRMHVDQLSGRPSEHGIRRSKVQFLMRTHNLLFVPHASHILNVVDATRADTKCLLKCSSINFSSRASHKCQVTLKLLPGFQTRNIRVFVFVFLFCFFILCFCVCSNQILNSQISRLLLYDE